MSREDEERREREGEGGRERGEVITNIGTIVVKAVIEARYMCIHHVHVSMGEMMERGWRGKG